MNFSTLIIFSLVIISLSVFSTFSAKERMPSLKVLALLIVVVVVVSSINLDYRQKYVSILKLPI